LAAGSVVEVVYAVGGAVGVWLLDV
jgi:hypothetical protein